MISTLWQMFALIACGVAWRYWRPGNLSAEQTRTVLTTLVYYLLLPALVLDVLWKADVGIHSLQYTLFGAVCLSFAMACIWLCGRLLRFKPQQLGAVLLATSFPNVTYLGLPVLEQTFGHWARSVAIQIDLFATAPALLTVGIAAARHYGQNGDQTRQPIWSFLTAPPFLAAMLAVVLNLCRVPAPLWLAAMLQKLSAGVVPLMLISLGLALSWRAVTLRNLPYVTPVILIKMGLMPWFALWFSQYLALDQAHKNALVLEMAMPCMVLGIVFCDRYQLDGSLYAMAVTVTTLLSLVTLPFWYQIATG
ncbi:AEC family transporter [Methylomicrobium sp. Wu6]|uniref:AEC family transporter n=1 Tax=Methylomicrobium sp. Wu6 TaxID=3107928 RepID=UPI002DD69B34|nr:AEC family transporter [Methylomicrobium sp. Wu6]MEC4747588.1 AEC family transporter [Methylomicrobium sp. Wu6]